MGFKFNLGDTVQITVSGETGTVTGRAEYTSGPPQFRIIYKCADGRAVEAWWEEERLSLT